MEKTSFIWSAVQEHIGIALLNHDKIVVEFVVSADYGYKKSIFFGGKKEQIMASAHVLFPLTSGSIEEACCLSINSSREILKCYSNVTILDVLFIHKASSSGHKMELIHAFKPIKQ